MHRILYLGGMGCLVWHIVLTQSLLHKVLVFVACGLWLLSHAYRVARRQSAVVTEKWTDSEVIRLRLRTSRPVAAFPGSYFYFHPPARWPKYNRLRCYAVMMLWSDVEQTGTGTTTDFYILVAQQSRYLRQFLTIEMGNRILLDGPYGQDLQLHRYETVILTAKGMGIVSVLPMALHLAARKAYDDSVRSRSNPDEDPTTHPQAPSAAASVFRDATRRIDLLWRLEHNNQDKWVADQLKALQELDPRGVMLLVWCIYPEPKPKRSKPKPKRSDPDPNDGRSNTSFSQPRTLDPPFQETPTWLAVYPEEEQSMADAEAPYSFETALRHEVLMPGKCIVVGMYPVLAQYPSADHRSVR